MFYVGQKVVCVEVGNWGNSETIVHLPVRGRIYTVRDHGDNWPALKNIPWVLLNEIHNSPDERYAAGEPSFRASRFRPAVERKTDISTLTALLNPANHRELSDA